MKWTRDIVSKLKVESHELRKKLSTKSETLSLFQKRLHTAMLERRKQLSTTRAMARVISKHMDTIRSKDKEIKELKLKLRRKRKHSELNPVTQGVATDTLLFPRDKWMKPTKPRAGKHVEIYWEGDDNGWYQGKVMARHPDDILIKYEDGTNNVFCHSYTSLSGVRVIDENASKRRGTAI